MDEAHEIQRLLTQVQDNQLAQQAHALDVETRAEPPPRPSPTKSVKSARVHDDDVSIKSWNQSDYSEDIRCARETHEKKDLGELGGTRRTPLVRNLLRGPP